MEDRFKFRAWDFRHHKMFEVESFGNNHQVDYVEDGKTIFTAFKPRYGYLNREECVLMQCTGLKNKNGKLIFEGDIVYNRWLSVYGNDIGNYYEVCFGSHSTDSDDYYGQEAYGFYGKTIKGEERSLNSIPCAKGEDLEIIGNKYENPELLTKD